MLLYQICNGLALSAFNVDHQIHLNRVAGVWRMSNATLEQNNTRIPAFWGPNPHGYLIFTSSGYFMDQINRSDLPTFPEDSRESGTPEDFRAVTTGSLGISGTYTVDANGNFESEHVTGCSFPN